MSCIGCDFNLLKDSARADTGEQSLQTVLLRKGPAHPDEKAILEQDAEKVEQALISSGPQSWLLKHLQFCSY